MVESEECHFHLFIGNLFRSGPLTAEKIFKNLPPLGKKSIMVYMKSVTDS